MRKGFFGKLLLTFCVMLGCMTGYGIVRLTGTGGGNIYNIISRTKDNTLDPEKDSVFFASDGGNPDLTLMPEENLQVEHTELENVTDLVLPVEDGEELEKTRELEITINPTVTPEPLEKAEEMEEKETTGQALLVTPIVEQVSDAEESLKNNREEAEKKQEEDGVKIGEKEVNETIAEGIEENQEGTETKEKEVKANEMTVEGIEKNKEETEIEEKEVEINEMATEGIKEQEWKANEIIAKGIKKKIEAEEMAAEEREEKPKGTENEMVAEGIEEQTDVTLIPEKTESAQVFTYPTEIFGQTPVINRSDEYVTYFEFALDLIETVEPEVKERGLSETALFAKFVVKALFCGVDVKTIKINAPISRSEAALALWLTAQVMEEKGTNTSATSGVSYVTDLGNCSSSEKKAIAYLYEQGVISGYQIAGQTFLPSKGLKTEDGTAWMTKIKQCWK